MQDEELIKLKICLFTLLKNQAVLLTVFSKIDGVPPQINQLITDAINETVLYSTALEQEIDFGFLKYEADNRRN